MPQFKVAHGYHLGPDPDDAELAKKEKRQPKEKEFPPGSVIDSPIDLVARFGQKFERLPEYPQQYQQAAHQQPLPPPHQPPVHSDQVELTARLTKMDQMSVKDLQALAADEEIDLKGQTNKAEIIKIIRAAVAP